MGDLYQGPTQVARRSDLVSEKILELLTNPCFALGEQGKAC